MSVWKNTLVKNLIFFLHQIICGMFIITHQNHFLAKRPQTRDLTSLCLSFLTCKMWLQIWLFWGLNEIKYKQAAWFIIGSLSREGILFWQRIFLSKRWYIWANYQWMKTISKNESWRGGGVKRWKKHSRWLRTWYGGKKV